MGKALSYEKRLQIINLYEKNAPFWMICQEVGCGISTAKSLVSQWKLKGRSSIPRADYSLCGKRETRYSTEIYKEAISLKESHRSWGAGLIRAKLSDKFKEAKLPCTRTLSSWFRKMDLNKKKEYSAQARCSYSICKSHT